MANKFNEKTTVEEILKFPKAEKILEKYQLPCLHCPMSRYEISTLKIGEVCKAYGIDLKNLLWELNKLTVKNKSVKPKTKKIVKKKIKK